MSAYDESGYFDNGDGGVPAGGCDCDTCPYWGEEQGCTAKFGECPNDDGYSDPADAALAAFEASHHVWYDDNDVPYLADGPAVAINSVPVAGAV